MVYRWIFVLFLFLQALIPIFAQGTEDGTHVYTIRGEVYIDFEPIYSGHVDSEYPLDVPTAGRRALEEAALFFSAMIYGWSFYYEVGERARQIKEVLELEAVDEIKFGDPGLRVTDTEIRDMRLWVWLDYHLNAFQQRRMQVWRSGSVRNAQAIGYAPNFIEEYPGWLGMRKIVLEDAARAALRAMLRASERNRPKEVTGFICLASFPRYYIAGGRMATSARFRVLVKEIVPYAAY